MEIKKLLKNKWLIVAVFIVMLVPMCSTITHEYGPYYGRVVDADTKEPIEGTAVLVEYSILQYGSLSGPITSFIDTQETLTDKNGEFTIPSIRLFAFRFPAKWELNPSIHIFKSEYGCYPNHKESKPLFVPNWTIPSDQYITIELPKLNTREQRIRNVDCYPMGVPDSKMRKYIRNNNIENKLLGLQETHVQGGSK